MISQFFAKDTPLVGPGECTATENKWKHHILPDHIQNHSEQIAFLLKKKRKDKIRLPGLQIQKCK